MNLFGIRIPGILQEISVTSWSRRSVIKSAIRITSPKPSLEVCLRLVANYSNLNIHSGALLKGVKELPPFDRFVFVMSVLERYSDRECSSSELCNSRHSSGTHSSDAATINTTAQHARDRYCLRTL